jgi:multiple sugar transport system substrate-binding protein
VIQNIVTGKAAHAILVIAAWPQMEDPQKSAVVGKLGLALPPHAPGVKPAPGLGHWLAGISKNVPAERKKAAVEFFRWFQTPEAQIEYAKVGGVPVSAAAYDAPIKAEPQYRWMKAMQEGSPLAVNIYTFPGVERGDRGPGGRDQPRVAGEVETAEALNRMADQIEQIMQRHNYKTGKLAALP